MAYLKAAGKAIMNSPKAIRKKFGGAATDEAQRHEQLEEDWYHSDDPINAGISFYVKYLGSAPVTRTHGPGSTDDAVKAIVHHAKHRGGKLQKVSLSISSKFIKLKDVAKESKLEDLPLYRVSYCTVDPYYDKVFCYISRNPEDKKLECHAFLCSKKSKAEAITLTVAQAFNIAYEKWQNHKKAKQRKAVKQARTEFVDSSEAVSLGDELTVAGGGAALTTSDPVSVTATTQRIAQIDIGITPAESPTRVTSKDDTNLAGSATTNNGLLSVKPTMTKAISLDYLHMEDEFDEEFTQLAEARSNPHLLDIGEHIKRATSQEEIKEMMKEGDKSTFEDLSRSKSIDDLLML